MMGRSTRTHSKKKLIERCEIRYYENIYLKRRELLGRVSYTFASKNALTLK